MRRTSLENPDPDLAGRLMRNAGLPTETLTGCAALPATVQELPRRVLTMIADTGRPPSGPALAASVAGLDADLGRARSPPQPRRAGRCPVAVHPAHARGPPPAWT